MVALFHNKKLEKLGKHTTLNRIIIRVSPVQIWESLPIQKPTIKGWLFYVYINDTKP